jgi:hypothetical protein
MGHWKKNCRRGIPYSKQPAHNPEIEQEKQRNPSRDKQQKANHRIPKTPRAQRLSNVRDNYHRNGTHHPKNHIKRVAPLTRMRRANHPHDQQANRNKKVRNRGNAHEAMDGSGNIQIRTKNTGCCWAPSRTGLPPTPAQSGRGGSCHRACPGFSPGFHAFVPWVLSGKNEM